MEAGSQKKFTNTEIGQNPFHRKILEDNAIWVLDSSDFNDPFDCNIPIAYDLLSSDNAIAEKFIRGMINNNKNKFVGNIEQEIEKRISSNAHKNSDFIAQYKEQMASGEQKRKWYILCHAYK